MSVLVFEGFLSTPEMLALLEPASVVQRLMDFEAALARAQGRCGVIPLPAAQAIASLCRVELYDVPALIQASVPAGSLALPVVQKLAETVGLFDPVAAGYVHWGSTSQDMVDSAMALLLRRSLGLIEDDLLQLLGHLLDLAEAHPAVPVLARTLMQPAQVSSLRHRLLNWIQPLLRSAQALRETADAALQLQYGGAVGTLGMLGDQAEAVSAALAAELKLPQAAMPWHTQRDRMVRLGAELGILCGALGKLARDLAWLCQPEIAEMAERQPEPGSPATANASEPGRGFKRCASSVMPHKNNPVALLRALAAAERAPQRVAGLLASMPQELERGLGGWHAELAEMSGLLLHAHGATRALAQGAQGLRVFPGRMREQIEAQQELVFAEALTLCLIPVMGREPAHRLVEQLCHQVAPGGDGLLALAQSRCQEDVRLRGRIDAGTLAAHFNIDAAAAQADRRLDAVLVAARQHWAALSDHPHW
ncbi:lyase family protein [Paucibacter sp. B51]|uniref:lyase family protein n=1 Tax=Paucibacter sp. B51 TaxID=2993315 RepID=UPI0022EBA7D3|nr:lyase family protein [Paucibacter sp. B51]